MIKFNDEHIVVGYVKQLLKSFNLPNFKVYVNDAKVVDSTDLCKIRYIKDGKIQERHDGNWQEVSRLGCYVYNQAMLNHTKNLVIRNTRYDSYTHEYLGDYLRFQRDYNKLNLMPLYNCFSNHLCSNVQLTKVGFDAQDTRYKIYALPVKLFEEYTIAIESDSPIELTCGLYNEYVINKELTDEISTKLYKKYASPKFSQPFKFDTKALTGLAKSELAYCSAHEQDFKLFIKVPTENNSAITVLEGDYLNWNDTMLYLSNKEDTRISNKYITNFEVDDRDGDDNFETFKPITRLQLLDYNSNTSIPFADKLIGYLCGNTITGLDEVEDDFIRAQLATGSSFDVEGVWDNKLQIIFYNYMKEQSSITNFYTSLDQLGYIDKDVEKHYIGKAALETIDIYPDLYKSNKVAKEK